MSSDSDASELMDEPDECAGGQPGPVLVDELTDSSIQAGCIVRVRGMPTGRNLAMVGALMPAQGRCRVTMILFGDGNGSTLSPRRDTLTRTTRAEVDERNARAQQRVDLARRGIETEVAGALIDAAVMVVCDQEMTVSAAVDHTILATGQWILDGVVAETAAIIQQEQEDNAIMLANAHDLHNLFELVVATGAHVDGASIRHCGVAEIGAASQ